MRSVPRHDVPRAAAPSEPPAIRFPPECKARRAVLGRPRRAHPHDRRQPADRLPQHRRRGQPAVRNDVLVDRRCRLVEQHHQHVFRRRSTGRRRQRSRWSCRGHSRPRRSACRRSRSCRRRRSPSTSAALAVPRTTTCRIISRSSRRGMRRDHPVGLGRPRVAGDDARPHPKPAVHQRGIARGQMQRRHRHAVAVGDRHRREIGPALGQQRRRPRRLGELDRRGVEQPDLLEEGLLPLLAEHHADMRRADVRRMHQHVLDRQPRRRNCGSRGW